MTAQWGAPLTGAQMKLLMAAGLPDEPVRDCDGSLISAGNRSFNKRHAPYCLPADHIAYTLLEKGWLDGRNVALWFGGEKAPDDWLKTSNSVLFRAGNTPVEVLDWEWEHFGGEGDIIAYIRKAEGMTTHADAERMAKRMGGELGQNELWEAFKNASPATLALPADVSDTPKMPLARHTAPQPETVTIAKMTEAEVSEVALSHRMTTEEAWGAIKFCRSMGLIREPTRLERFWATRDIRDVRTKAFQLIEEAVDFE